MLTRSQLMNASHIASEQKVDSRGQKHWSKIAGDMSDVPKVDKQTALNDVIAHITRKDTSSEEISLLLKVTAHCIRTGSLPHIVDPVPTGERKTFYSKILFLCANESKYGFAKQDITRGASHLLYALSVNLFSKTANNTQIPLDTTERLDKRHLIEAALLQSGAATRGEISHGKIASGLDGFGTGFNETATSYLDDCHYNGTINFTGAYAASVNSSADSTETTHFHKQDAFHRPGYGATDNDLGSRKPDHNTSHRFSSARTSNTHFENDEYNADSQPLLQQNNSHLPPSDVAEKQ